MGEIGVLSARLEKEAGAKLVDLVKERTNIKGVAKILIVSTIPWTVKLLDNYLMEMIPEPWNQQIEDTLIVIFEQKDYDMAIK